MRRIEPPWRARLQRLEERDRLVRELARLRWCDRLTSGEAVEIDADKALRRQIADPQLSAAPLAAYVVSPITICRREASAASILPPSDPFAANIKNPPAIVMFLKKFIN